LHVERRYTAFLWAVGVVVIAVFAVWVFAVFFVGKTGPFAAVSQIGRDGKIYGVKGATDFHDDLRSPTTNKNCSLDMRPEAPAFMLSGESRVVVRSR
jgi:hypothetical protein